MTLIDVIPTLRKSVRPHYDARLWPEGTWVDASGDLVVGGVPLAAVAAQFGTPGHVVDERQVRSTCREYRRVMPGIEIAYAGKAFLCRAMVRWLMEEGLSLDVCSAGEIAIARAAGMPAERVILHGNVKTPEDLKAAYEYGVGRIVIDSMDEIHDLATLTPGVQPVLIRVTPDVDGGSHRAITTGIDNQKFGFPISDGQAMAAVRQVLTTPNLRLVGVHCHLGSQIHRVVAFELAARRMIDFIGRVRDQFGVTLSQLNMGGGHAVRYEADDDDFDLRGLTGRLRGAVNFESACRGLPVPALTVEPGRAIVARAGMTIYRVAVVKRGVRTFIGVDGGMSDNPRPALYGARYSVSLIGRSSTAPNQLVSVVGRHCESGDVIAEDVPLASDVRVGDLLAVPVTGAYHHSLSSNYNAVGRPPVIAVADGAARPLIRRETDSDLLARDVG